MAIYTKKGDRGITKVFDKKTQRLIDISKGSVKIRLIGEIDELNSFLGMVKSFNEDKEILKMIEEIQENLFITDSILAGSKLHLSRTKTKRLEKEIDKWERVLPLQKNFIFYGGSKESSLIFYARALVRRAERSLVSLSKKEEISEPILMYFNRLSDYLFILGRSVNFKSKNPEKFWKR